MSDELADELGKLLALPITRWLTEADLSSARLDTIETRGGGGGGVNGRGALQSVRCRCFCARLRFCFHSLGCCLSAGLPITWPSYFGPPNWSRPIAWLDLGPDF